MMFPALPFDIPATHAVTRNPYSGSTEDGLGNTIPSYGDPVELRAYTIGPHTVEEGTTTPTETEVADVDVSMPKTVVNLKDKFSIDGDEYEVVGVQDWTKGFHGWEPGIVVELKRVS